MPTLKQTSKQVPLCNANPLILAIIITALLVIAISSVAHTSLALSENSRGNSNVVRQQCLNGLENAAVEAKVCTQADLSQFNNVLYLRETQGIKAAKDACFSQMSSQGCKGLCVAAINCYDIQ